MKDAVKTLVQEAIALMGLPISSGLPAHGSGDDYALWWSGQRTQGMPESFFSQVHICGNERALGFHIEVSAYGYDLNTHDGFSIPYWGKTNTQAELARRREALIEEVRMAVLAAWNDLPRLHQQMLQKRSDWECTVERLRREGKIIE